jgi:protoporphyrinogen oxidase
VHTIILGAGISGLTAAYGLSRIPAQTYRIYEQQPRTGGYCQSERQDGFTYDVVSHVLHFRTPETQQLVRELLDGNLVQHKRRASIYFRHRYIPYPFQMNLGYLSPLDRASCFAGFCRAWLRRRMNADLEPGNFEEWIQRYLGEGLARRFMRPYNTKLWGRPPEQLSVDWLRPFVPQTSGWSVLASVLSKFVTQVGYNSYFYYPERGGIQTLVESLESRVAPVQTNHRAVEINLNRRTVRFQDGLEASYDRLFSTIPLKTLALLAIGLPDELRRDAEELRCTSLLALTYCISAPLPHSYHWLYFPEPQYPFFRIVFQSNISSSLAPENSSMISVEISEPDANRQGELDQSVRQHLVELGFIRKASDIRLSARNHFTHAYPVHDLGREARVSRLLEFFKSRDVWSIGRFGAWRYSSIDDAITEALEVVREAVESPPAAASRMIPAP